MDTRITETDLHHLNAFPHERKAPLMQRIAAHEPNLRSRHDGKHDFEKTLLKLRREGFALIDLQSQEAAFTSVWYRKGEGMLLARRRPEVTMVVWEYEESGSFTTVLTWWL